MSFLLTTRAFFKLKFQVPQYKREQKYLCREHNGRGDGAVIHHMRNAGLYKTQAGVPARASVWAVEAGRNFGAIRPSGDGQSRISAFDQRYRSSPPLVNIPG